MELYCGIDLHSNNNFVAIVNRDLEDVICRRLRNDLGQVLEFLEPYREEIVAVAVESTYNWYWLVDGLKEAGYDVRLVNTTKAANYADMKYTDDKHDARWIARLLALGILPEGYIVAPEERGLRDLLRRRSFLVQKRTAHLLSLRNAFERSTGKRIETAHIHEWTGDTVRSLIVDPLVAESLTVMLPVVRVLNIQIKNVEKKVLAEAKPRAEFRLLKTAPGIGDILAMTIMCETVDIARFPKVGNYVSYCRCAKSEHTSNQKKKGSGNRKNGNRYLSWAYSEAAHHARRHEPLVARYYARKRTRSRPIVAKRALAAKIARACYYVLRDQTSFDPSRAFN
jgi:transposase